MSVAVPRSSDKNISSDEDNDFRRGTVNSNTNNTYTKELNRVTNHHPKMSDHDHAHEITISTTAAGKASSKEKKSCT